MRHAIAEPDYLINPPEAKPDDCCDSCGIESFTVDLIAGQCEACVIGQFEWAASVAARHCAGEKVGDSDRMEAAQVLRYAAEMVDIKLEGRSNELDKRRSVEVVAKAAS